MIFINKDRIASLLALFSFLALSGPVGAAVTDGNINAGLLYHNYCSVCHGDKGNGESRASRSLTPPPRDFTSELSRRELVRERIIHSITHGRKGTAMAAWKSQLSEQEIAALADYLQDTFIRVDDRLDALPGKKLYEQNCAVCHGDRGDGGQWTDGLKRKPRDFTSAAAAELDRATMIQTVRRGRPGTPMASFAGQLDAQQIEQVVDYIRLAFMQKAPTVSGISGTRAHGIAPRSEKDHETFMQAAMPNGLQGDISRGRDFYMGNCFTCHGVTGNGDGPRAYFINPKPADFHSDKYRQRLNRPALFRAIRDGKLGTEMPAWGKVLDEQQLADIAEFVFRAFISGEKELLTTAKKKAQRE